MRESNGRSVGVGTVHGLRLYRTITVATCGSWKVRVWKQSPDFDLGCSPPIVNALAKLDNDHCMPSQIASALDKIHGIIAFEITDTQGNGGIVHNIARDVTNAS